MPHPGRQCERRCRDDTDAPDLHIATGTRRLVTPELLLHNLRVCAVHVLFERLRKGNDSIIASPPFLAVCLSVRP
jgi:hypothetical protein